MASRSSVAAAFERVKDKFEVERLKDEQLDILTAIMRGDDCVGVLPTGYGKSLPYQVSKMVANELGIEFHKVVVCSPLISLMQDQVARLQSFGHIMKVMHVKGQEDCHSVEDCDVIFSSPENLVGNEALRNSLARLKVSLLVVDEFHTVSTWGELSKNESEKIFRRWFRHLGELRSIFPNAGMLALSATCTDSILQEVLSALAMESANRIIVSPDKSNIKYTVFRTGRAMESSLFWLIDEIRETDMEHFPRTLIYCNSILDVARIFMYVKTELPDCNAIEMFHSETNDDIKTSIVSDLSSSEGFLKIVVCTSALGMGVDIKNCKNIILYGPPRNVVDLVQIVGRAGRDGTNASALILCSSYQIARIEKHMKEIILADTCRRKIITSHFLYAENIFNQNMHRCCDNCAKICTCKNCEVPYLERVLIDSHTVDKTSSEENSQSDSDSESHE